MRPFLSAVMPVLDEAARIRASVGTLLDDIGVDELVVVDGGSTDGTVDTLAGLAAERPRLRLAHGPHGRGPQLHHGAALARGLVLWFVHCDVQPPTDAGAHIRRALLPAGVVGGAFRTCTTLDDPVDRPWFRPVLPLADLRSRYTGLPYGDQALFCRADAYHRCGGFPDQPLLEDVELARRLRLEGRLVCLPASVTVSARRWRAHPLRTAAVMNTFPLLYRLGVSPERLARWYGRPR